MKRLALLLLLATAPAAAAKWTVDPAQSRIGFSATWLGRVVPGTFRKWSAAIDFDPAAPDKAVVGVTVDLASAATGDKTVDTTLPGADWFAVAAASTAHFTAQKIVAQGPGRYVATGTLTIRGKAVPVSLPFALAVAGDVATVNGRVQLDRRAWKLGLDTDATAGYVAFAVPLTIHVVARRSR